MRKHLAIILGSLYLLSSFGLLVNFHFCNDSLEQIALYKSTDACCCDAGMTETNSDCCENTSLYLGEEIPTIAPQTNAKKQLDVVAIKPIALPLLRLPIPVFNQAWIVTTEEKTPPDDLYAIYQQFLFYG